MKTCSLIVPVFNEESVIEKTIYSLQTSIEKTPEFSFEIICVNDGSTDNTALRLKTIPGITIITHSANRGYGAALRTGLDYCSSEWVFIVDADGTYPIDDLAMLLRETDKFDMVVGARVGPGISRHPFKALARWILRSMVKGLTGTMVPDLNSGMRVFRHSIYQEFRHLLPMGFSFTSTITVASLYSGYAICYRPIKYETRIGKSKIRPVKDFFAFSMLILRLASYFEPLNFFLPLVFILMIGASLRVVRDIWLNHYIGSLSIILIFFAMNLFVLGVLADVIVRRSKIQGSRNEAFRSHHNVVVTDKATSMDKVTPACVE